MGGPWVSAATFCETVIEGKDGVLSLIRVIDQINIAAANPSAPEELPPGKIQTNLVVMLKSDEAVGRWPLTIRCHLPSGQTLPDQMLDLHFTGQERGNNLILQMQLDAMEGLYWFDVMLNDQMLTRVPLRVIYQRMSAGV